MSKSDITTVSFRFPSQLIVALDKLVQPPEIRDRTQLVTIILTRFVNQLAKGETKI